MSNSPSFADDDVMDFFTTATTNIIDAAKAAGVGHYVALSVVGAELMVDSGYQRAKVAQEKLIKLFNGMVSVAACTTTRRVSRCAWPKRRRGWPPERPTCERTGQAGEETPPGRAPTEALSATVNPTSMSAGWGVHLRLIGQWNRSGAEPNRNDLEGYPR